MREIRCPVIHFQREAFHAPRASTRRPQPARHAADPLSEATMTSLLGTSALRTLGRRSSLRAVKTSASGSHFNAFRATSAFSTAVSSTPYEESWHTREASLQERLEVYKTPLTREEEGLRFQIKHVSNRDVSEREIAPERASS